MEPIAGVTELHAICRWLIVWCMWEKKKVKSEAQNCVFSRQKIIKCLSHYSSMPGVFFFINFSGVFVVNPQVGFQSHMMC